jgi:hypothetical protein
MPYRALDVVFQYFLRLAAAIVIVPLGVGGVRFALDHALTV